VSICYILGIVIFTVLINGNILHSFFSGIIKPDLVLILVTMNSFIKSKGNSLVVAFLSGIIRDFLSGQFIGLNTIINLLNVKSTEYIKERFLKSRIFMLISILVFNTFVKQVIYSVVMYIFDLEFKSALPSVHIMLRNSILNAVTGSLVYICMYLRWNKYERKLFV